MRQLNTGHYASKFATSWICFGRIFKPLEAGRLVRFQKAGKYMHLGKTQCWNLFAICKATLFYFHYDSDKIKIAHYYPKLRTTAQATIITHFQAKIRQIFKFSMAIKFRTCKGKFSFEALLILKRNLSTKEFSIVFYPDAYTFLSFKIANVYLPLAVWRIYEGRAIS